MRREGEFSARNSTLLPRLLLDPGFGIVTRGAQGLKVCVLVVAGAASVVYMVHFEWDVFDATVLAGVVVAVKDSFAGGGGDVFGAV